MAPTFPTRRQVAIACVATAPPAIAAVILTAVADVPWIQATGLPLLFLGLLLIAWHTHWGLCFTAFSIGPLGVMQQEVLGVTLNLPEVFVLALVAKEGVQLLRQEKRMPATLPYRTLAVFLVASAVALVTGLVHGNGVVRVLQDCRQFTEFLVLFWLVLQCVNGRDEALRIAACYAAGATLLAVHGIVQQIVPVGISATQISSDLVLHHGIRSGSFYGATTLGGIMVLAIAPAIGVTLSTRRRWVQILMGLCILLCLIAIVFTRTRGSWLGLGVAMALIGVSVRPSGKALATVACAGMALLLVLGPLVVQRLYTLADPEQDISLMARAQYYAAAARIGEAHPLLGLGWGCYYDIDAILQAERYVETSYAEVEDKAPSDRGETAGEATVHSAYLQLFVKTGIVGLGAFLAIIVVWLERVWRGRNTRFQSDTTHALFIGITAGIAGYLFHSTFENFFQWPVMAQSFWLLFGLSFVLAPNPAAQIPHYRIPITFVGSAAAIFLIFMYACMRLETFHTDHFERNVAKALEEGNLEKALHIAHRATEVELYEPMPFTVYGRLLLQKGDVPAALHALETALGTTERPPALRTRCTGPRYYFAPARLTLGAFYAGRGDWDRALQQFELARAYADLSSDEFAEFHPVLYTAYSTRGRWARALEFGRPDEPALSSHSPYNLLRIARAAAAKGDWSFVQSLVALLLDSGEFASETHYLEGRALLAERKLDDAIDAFAIAKDYPETPWYAGTALARAANKNGALTAFLSTPDTVPFRPMALAVAWSLLKEKGDTQGADAVLTRLRDALGRLPQVHPSSTTDQDRLALQSYFFAPPALEADGSFPALFVWCNGSADLSAISGVSVVENDHETRAYLTGTGLVLQLRQVVNRASWTSVERAYPTDEVIPGWIDAARDWFDLRDAPSSVISDGGGENPALLLNRTAWILSVPIRVPAEAACLLTGRIRDPEGRGRFGWQSLDPANLVLRDGAAADCEPLAVWTSCTGLIPPEPNREVVRIILESDGTPSNVYVDDLFLCELSPPPLEPTS